VRTIDKYLLREFLLPVVYCFDAFVMLYIVQDLLGRLGEFIQLHARVSQVINYYIIILPEALVVMLPVAILLGLLFCLSNLGKNNELIAFRASGISHFRLAAPFLIAGIVATVLVFVVNEAFVPTVKARAEAFKNELRGNGGSRTVLTGFFYANTAHNREWHIGRFNTRTMQLDFVEIHQRKPDGTALLDLFAQSATWTDGQWRFSDAHVYDHTQPQDQIVHVAVTNFPAFSESPDRLALEGREPEQLRTSELRQLIPHASAKLLATYKVELHRRYAFPWVCLIVIWLGFPLGIHVNRRGGALLGVGTALVLVVAFFLIMNIALALGKGDRIPAVVAAWLPNAIFAGIGAVLLWRKR
jgi:lipopolysaccharide export system permease protein